MIKIKKLSFKNLKNLNIQERIEAAKTPGIGQTLMSALTPTQIAELFPRYYLMREPDISGFLKAMPTSMSAARQAQFQEQLNNTASGAAAGSNMESGGWKRKLQQGVNESVTVTRPGQAPAPKLTEAQLATANLLTSGKNIAVDDPQVKFISTLTPEQLKTVNLEKYKDESGKEFYKYAPPPITEEQVKKTLQEHAVRSPRENAVIALINKKEGVSGENGFNMILGDHKGSPGTSILGKPPKPVSEMNLNELRDWQTQMLRNPANKWNSSAVGAGQFVRDTLFGRGGRGGGLLSQVGIKEQDFDNITFGKDLQKKLILENFKRSGVGDPNADPSTWNFNRLGAQWQSMDNSHRPPTDSELQEIREASSEKPRITNDYTKAEMEAGYKMVERERASKFIGDLTVSSQAQMGLYTETGRATFNGEMPRVIADNTKGYCGIGSRHAAGQMFGVDYFNQGLSTGSEGGASNAASLSRGNKYFQKSGFYKDSASISEERIKDQEYLNSLPVGTVISAQGGSGEGHVQIKVGPNHWMSDFDQKNRVLLGRKDGQMYHGFMVHEPNDAGIKHLRQRGFDQTVTNDKSQSVVNSSVGVVNSSKQSDTEIKAQPKEDVPVSQLRRESSVVESATKPDTTGVKPPPQGRLKLDETKAPATAAAPSPVPEKKPEPQTIKQFVKGEGYAGIKDVPNPKYVPNTESKDTGVGPKRVDTTVTTDAGQKKPDTAQGTVNPQPHGQQKLDTVPQPVKTNALGGSNRTHTDQITALPIGGIKDDNSVVVDSNQRPLFTMNTNKETAVYDPTERKVDVIPNQKPGQVGRAPEPGNDLQQQLDGLKADILGMNENTQAPAPQDAAKGSVSHISDRDPHMIEQIMDMTRNLFLDPSAARAFSRARFHETGDATNDFHHSSGNSNMQ